MPTNHHDIQSIMVTGSRKDHKTPIPKAQVFTTPAKDESPQVVSSMGTNTLISSESIQQGVITGIHMSLGISFVFLFQGFHVSFIFVVVFN